MASLSKLMAALTCAAVLGSAVPLAVATPVAHKAASKYAVKSEKPTKTKNITPRKTRAPAQLATSRTTRTVAKRALRIVPVKNTAVAGRARQPLRLAKATNAASHIVAPARKKQAPRLPTKASVSRLPALGSGALLVMDQTSGTKLLEKNAAAARPIASITKLMTAMVLLDARPNMNEVLTVEDSDVDRLRHSASRLQVGTQLPRKEMLRLALMSSENRAAHALGRTYPGGLPAFVAAMNRKAHALGMTSAHFVDPTGLRAENMASPKDLAKMVAAAAMYPVIKAYTTSEQATIPVARREQVFRNTNPLVRQGRWDIALSKTGYIEEAGRCLVMKAFIRSRPTVIVLLDGPGKNTRVQDAINIKQWLEKQPGLQASRATDLNVS